MGCTVQLSSGDKQWWNFDDGDEHEHDDQGFTAIVEQANRAGSGFCLGMAVQARAAAVRGGMVQRHDSLVAAAKAVPWPPTGEDDAKARASSDCTMLDFGLGRLLQLPHASKAVRGHSLVAIETKNPD